LDRITRKELKTDRFAQEVTHTVEFVEEHRRQVVLFGGIALALVVLSIGFYYYRKQQHLARQEALIAATRIREGYIGAAPSNAANTKLRWFNTQEEKDKATQKAMSDLIAKYPGSHEADMAQYFLGVVASDAGKTDEADRRLRDVSDHGSPDYASLAKLALAQLEISRGKTPEAEKLLRSVVANPTMMVSAEQATITLAEVIGPSRPEEARKLLEPLRVSPRSAVSRYAITAFSRLPQPEPPKAPPAPPAK